MLLKTDCLTQKMLAGNINDVFEGTAHGPGADRPRPAIWDQNWNATNSMC